MDIQLFILQNETNNMPVSKLNNELELKPWQEKLVSFSTFFLFIIICNLFFFLNVIFYSFIFALLFVTLVLISNILVISNIQILLPYIFNS